MNKSIEIAKELVKQGMSLAYCPEDVKNDKESVLAAVRNNGADLQYASDELKNDKEVVLAAINNQTPLSEANVDDLYSVIRFASDEIKKNKEVALEAVKKRGNAFIYLSDELKNDKEVAITAIKENINNFEIGNGYLLQYASSDLQNDKEVVMETIKANAKCYEFASPEIKKEINKVGGPKEWLNKQEDIRIEKKIDQENNTLDQNGRFTTGPSELAKNFSDVAKQNNNSISKDKNITTPTHNGDAI